MNKQVVYNLIIFTLLFALLIIRIVCNEIPSNCFSTINMIGIPIAVFNLMLDINIYVKDKSTKHILLGFGIIILLLLIILCVLIFMELILISPKEEEIVTIIILLLSLPNNLYYYIINTINKKKGK